MNTHRHIVQFDVVQVVNAPNHLHQPIFWRMNILRQQGRGWQFGEPRHGSIDVSIRGELQLRLEHEPIKTERPNGFIQRNVVCV